MSRVAELHVLQKLLQVSRPMIKGRVAARSREHEVADRIGGDEDACMHTHTKCSEEQELATMHRFCVDHCDAPHWTHQPQEAKQCHNAADSDLWSRW
eukprot:CAMPEP_0183415288 /NCGR_PEP_ID=MMETSP0370-20130417/22987_1 /TAXON_ID=268820 /ORGANISM="Peridinium aciculiferum, Strain PAER-2" /LENGTH=96 /DNA_ID=CAMNT_0025598693 /DNA_START=427 /DNA_END=717 /DNA_ORIENTATION=-